MYTIDFDNIHLKFIPPNSPQLSPKTSISQLHALLFLTPGFI